MKITFKTDLKEYQFNCFPENLTQVPRIGDFILVREATLQYYASEKLPCYLEVTKVFWTDKGVVCELDYTKKDLELQNKFK